MKIKLTGIIAASVLGFALLPTAQAQDDTAGGFTGPGTGVDGGSRRAGQAFPGRGRGPGGPAARRGGPSPQRILDRLDSDEDGYISADEYTDPRVERLDDIFARLDTDGDGLISLAESERPERAERPERPERPARPERPNRPERPELDREALHACVRQTIADYMPPEIDLDERFENVDTSGDGYISLTELSIALQERSHALFERIDADADGLVSLEELEAAFEQELNIRRVIRACVQEQLTAGE